LLLWLFPELIGVRVFITFEGIEGAGKSLQIARVEEYLKRKGIPCLTTREPGGTEFGKALRPILLGTDGCRREPVCELLLYLADRHQHLKEVIEPALKRNRVVLSDRYQDATRAYQGAARGIAESTVEQLTRLSGITEPDKTLLLDLDPEEGLPRALHRNETCPVAGAEGRFEAENLTFHKRVREAYLSLAARFPERIHVVDASGTPDQVFSHIVPLIDSWTSPPY
jgi:dTMP kinase